MTMFARPVVSGMAAIATTNSACYVGLEGRSTTIEYLILDR